MSATSDDADDSQVPADDLQCRDLVELVTDYLEGVLEPVLEQRIREHLAICDGCADYVEQIRAIAGMAAQLHDDDLPAELRAGLLVAFKTRATDFGAGA